MAKIQHPKKAHLAHESPRDRGRLILRVGMATLGGLGVVLSFPTFDLAPLAWITLMPILWSAFEMRGSARFFLGWWAGTVINLGGFYWIIGTLMDFGHMSWLPAFLLALLLVAYQGLHYAFWLWLVFWFQKTGASAVWWVSPIVYVALEYLHPVIFPWFIANSQYSLIPIIQCCELGGVTLLSLMVVLSNSLLFETWIRLRRGFTRAWLCLICAGLVPVSACLFGWIRMDQMDAKIDRASKLNIGLVEADVGIWEKEDPIKIKDNLVLHQRMSIDLEQRGAELIVWPETAYHASRTLVRRSGQAGLEWHRPIPKDVELIPPSGVPPPLHAADDIKNNTSLMDRYAPQRGFSTPLLFGALTYQKNPQSTSPRHPGIDLFNTAILLDGAGRVLGSYDKVYLLMFGEHVPWGHTYPILFEWFPEAGDLAAGASVEVITMDRYRIGVMICYEDILPAFTRKVADQKPHILINITNDAWFGKTSEPYLHLALSVFRAVENRVGLVRSTNTGISAFVDPNGRILESTGLHQAETLLRSMPMLQSDTLYQRLGDWPAYLCILFTGGWFLVLWTRKKFGFKTTSSTNT